MHDLNKKISIFIGSLRGGGAEQVCVSLANGLSEYFNIDLVLLDKSDSILLDRLSDKVNVIDLNTKQVRFSFIKIYLYLIFTKPFLCLVLEPYVSFLICCYKLLFRLKVKIISRCINTLSLNYFTKNKINNLFQKIILKIAYNYSDLTVAQCVGMKMI